MINFLRYIPVSIITFVISILISIIVTVMVFSQTKPITYINAQQALMSVSKTTPLPVFLVPIDSTTYVIMVRGDIIKTSKPIPCKIY